MSDTVYVCTQGEGNDRIYQHNITGITRATTAVVTFASHSFYVGDSVTFSNTVGGMTQIRGLTGLVLSRTPTEIEVNINSSAFGFFSSGGYCYCERKIIQGITQANPAVVTCNGHGFANGEWVSFLGISGMTELSWNVYQVANMTTDTFELSSLNSTGFGAFTSGFLIPVYLTPNFAAVRSFMANGWEIRIRETLPHTTHTLGDVTFTFNSNTINTAGDYTGVISAGDYIGKPTWSGNGAEETVYRVININSVSITVEGYYAGTTATVSGIKRATIKQEGLSGRAIVQSISMALKISGGWVFSTIAQTSETWFRHAFDRLASTHRGCYISSGTEINHLNFASCYENYIAGNSFVISCTLGGYVYPMSVLSPCTIDTVRACPSAGPSWPAMRITSNGVLLSNVVVSSWHTAGSYGVSVASDIEVDFSTCKIIACGYGINQSGGSYIKNGTITGCNYGIYTNSSYHCAVEGFDINNCVYGALAGGASGGNFYKDCSIQLCGTGLTASQHVGLRCEGVQFANNNYDFSQDQYCSNNTFVDCTHLAPATRAYNRTGQGGPITIINCTIDPASATKTFLQTANDNYFTPQFLLQNSFGATGAYYGKYEIVRNDLTVPPSVQTKFNSSVTLNKADYKIASTYARQGVGKVLTIKLEALTAGWTGTIIPKIKLNQITIQTGTTINSVSYGSKDEYTFTLLGTALTQDGELSIEFNVNSNTVPLLISEFEVQDA